MRRNRFLLATCAAICLSLPAASLAAPPDSHNQPGAQGDQQSKKAAKGHPQAAQEAKGGPAKRGGQPSAAVGTPAVQGAGGSHGRAAQAGKGDQGRGQTADQGKRGQTGTAASSGSSQAGAQRGASVRAPQTVQRTGPVSPASQAAQRSSRQPSPPPALSGWDRNARGPQRAQLAEQWRGQHHNWDQNAPWRGNPDWWRNDSGFRRYTGARVGFFFFPGFGYITAPPQYRHHRWRAGENLPRWFWRYTVNNYWRYGLPRPPGGCAWIWLDGNVALVDLADGYILDIVYNVW